MIVKLNSKHSASVCACILKIGLTLSLLLTGCIPRPHRFALYMEYQLVIQSSHPEQYHIRVRGKGDFPVKEDGRVKVAYSQTMTYWEARAMDTDFAGCHSTDGQTVFVMRGNQVVRRFSLDTMFYKFQMDDRRCYVVKLPKA